MSLNEFQLTHIHINVWQLKLSSNVKLFTFRVQPEPHRLYSRVAAGRQLNCRMTETLCNFESNPPLQILYAPQTSCTHRHRPTLITMCCQSVCVYILDGNSLQTSPVCLTVIIVSLSHSAIVWRSLAFESGRTKIENRVNEPQLNHWCSQSEIHKQTNLHTYSFELNPNFSTSRKLS